MSYDLAVFDPLVVPVELSTFLSWFDEQTEWQEPHDYNDPKVSSVTLQAWFLDMIVEFPALNGPYASDDPLNDEASLTDYSVGSKLIYAAFAWSKMRVACETTYRFAAKHQLGLFNVSSEAGEVWLPDSNGDLILCSCEANRNRH